VVDISARVAEVETIQPMGVRMKEEELRLS